MEKSNITLYVPKIEDYWYEQKLLSDLEIKNRPHYIVSDSNIEDMQKIR